MLQVPATVQPGGSLVGDQYLIGADGKPLRGPAGQFHTTTDLARAAEASDPFQLYGRAYGYATGTIVGGVLIPAVDPATGVPLTGLFQSPCASAIYLDANGDDETPALVEAEEGNGVLGFDGLLGAPPATVWQRQEGVLLQPRGAPDLFVDGGFPATERPERDDGDPASGHIEQLLRNMNFSDQENNAASEEVSAILLQTS